MEREEDKLWEVYNLLKNSTNDIYELQLLEVLDNALANYGKMNNILDYFKSQIIQHNLKSALGNHNYIEKRTADC